MRESKITLPDGRVLSYAELGKPDGPPLILCHGTPGSRLDLTDGDLLVRSTGARVIVPDRPGYGASSPHPARTLSDYGSDIGHLADALRLNQFFVAGGSGGGPHALACAHALPGRVRACLVFGSPAPCDFPGATDGMSFGNKFGVRLADRGGWLYRKLLGLQARGFLQEPDSTLRALARAVDPTDAAILLHPDCLIALRRTMPEAYRQGIEGHAVDGRLGLTARPWSFRFDEIRVPVYIWHGEQDRLVSPAMGRRLADQIPGAQLFMLPNIGHLVSDHEAPVEHMARVIEQHWQPAAASAPPGQSD